MPEKNTTSKPTEPPHLPALRRLFVESMNGRTDDPEALADDLEAAWLLPVWKQWQTGAGKHFPKGLKVRGPSEHRDHLQAVADKLREVLPDLCGAYRCALVTLAPETPDAASLRARHLMELEEENRFALGAYPELLRVVSVIEDAARANAEHIRTGPAPWLAPPEAQIAGALRLQLEKRGIACHNRKNEPYRCAAVWIWPYLDLTGDPAEKLRDALRRPARSTPPAPSLPAWPRSSTRRTAI